MLDLPTIETFYEHFYSKKYRLKYRLKQSKKTVGVCRSFLALIDKKYSLHCVDKMFLWEYFIFQFNYWHDLTIKSFYNKLSIEYIVGKKAFDRWDKRDREFDWIIDDSKTIERLGVQKNVLFTDREQRTKVNKHDSSRAIRKQFHNTERGFACCIEFTTLFDGRDVSCVTCKFKQDCKELLRSNYPALYKERGLANG